LDFRKVLETGVESPKLRVKAENFALFFFSLGTLGVVFGHTFGTFFYLDFFLWADSKGGCCGVLFWPCFGADSKGDYLELCFSLFFWHNFLISSKGAHLRDLFQGLGLPLFGLWAHLTKLLVALIGPFWVHFETLERA
jgi:hypothetical protein